MSTRPHAVLFDAAGTLLAPKRPVGETYRGLARDFGVDLPATRIEEAFHRVLARAEPMVFPNEPYERRCHLERQWWWSLVRATFRAADSTARFSDFDAYFARLWSHYAGGDAWQLAPGARRALDALRTRGSALGIVSNFDHRLPDILQGLDIAAYFKAVVIPSEVGAAKPDAAIFAAALAQIGQPCGTAFYVGDRTREDLVGARRAGLHPIAVTSLATLAELPARIEALEQELQ